MTGEGTDDGLAPHRPRSGRLRRLGREIVVLAVAPAPLTTSLKYYCALQRNSATRGFPTPKSPKNSSRRPLNGASSSELPVHPKRRTSYHLTALGRVTREENKATKPLLQDARRSALLEKRRERKLSSVSDATRQPEGIGPSPTLRLTFVLG